MRGGKVQGVNRNGHVLGLRGGHVFYSRRGRSRLDVPDLSDKLLLAGGEWNFGVMYLQRRVVRHGSVRLHLMLSGKVQATVRCGHVHGLQCRHVLWSTRGVSKLDVSDLSVKLQLAGRKQRTGRVHV